MSEKERTRYHLMRLVKSGRLSLKEASLKMGLSYGQSKRAKARPRLGRLAAATGPQLHPVVFS